MQKHKKSILALFLIASLCVSVLGAGTAYTRSTALDEEGTNQVSYSSQNLEENDTVYMLMTDRFFDGNSSNNGTFNEEYRPGDLHYYQGGEVLTGVNKLPSYTDGEEGEYWYDLGETGRCEGKLTGLFEYQGKIYYAIKDRKSVV